MGVSFTEPLWWLPLPVILAAAWYLRLPWLQMARLAGRGPWRREIFRVAFRFAILILLVAVLAGPHLVKPVQRQAVILALDASASVGPARSHGEQWIREALAARPASALAGVVAFGQQALVEEPPGLRPVFHQLGTDPGMAGSRVGEALRLAGALFPEDARRRVVLLSDGRDTGGDAVAAARQLREEGVRVDVVPLGGPAGPDVRVEALKVPPRARVGEKATLEVVVTATRDTRATLYIDRDGMMVASREVQLRVGENRISLSVDAGSAGLHSYQARVVAADPALDVFTANNRAGAVQQVSGPPHVLVVSPDIKETVPLVRSLRSAGKVEVTVVTPESVPGGLAAWARYQAVFLVNVPAFSLGEKTMQEIETYVRDGGGGLVMVGGPDSYGPGGYAGTPVERALPVEMRISGRGEMPSLGLMLVIDKSGSMSGEAGGADKMSLAREAAARSISILTKKDRVGVIAFDSQPWLVVPLTPADDRERLRQEIGRIYAGGGTEIFPALASAYEALKDAPTRVKHIILLTDGISASGGSYQELARAMQEKGITLTCVAVGPGADAGMLKALAELGRGRFYATADAGTIPAIFTRETVMATRSFAVNERFFPRAAAASPLLQGLEKVPFLEGYITTTARDRAETVLVSHRGDPVLAAWQYGLGRAVAWTPDAAGRWSAAWVQSQVFPRLWGNVLSWILPAVDTSPVQVQAEVISGAEAAAAVQGEEPAATAGGTPQAGAPGDSVVRVTVDDPGHWQMVRRFTDILTGPDGETRTFDLHPAGPGRYTGQTAVAGSGAYLVSITATNGGSRALVAQTGLVVSYPAEYRETGVDLDRLEEIARAGGGTVLASPAEAFAPNLPPVWAGRDLSSPLLALAAVLWLLDVAGRRLVIGPEERAALRRAWATAWRRMARRGGYAAEPAPAWTGRTLATIEKLGFRAGRRDRTATGGQTDGGEEAGSKAPGWQQVAYDAGGGKQTGSLQERGDEALAGATRVAGPVPPGGRMRADSGRRPELDDLPVQDEGVISPGQPGSPQDTAARLLAAKRRRKK
ncbi:uncharacterized protein YegL [Desulfofundulus luciae]|uniref:Uncharacterized protein YegL n=1 Tax=Desulfofundulus luciae TaxID=74702 RepID=A0ABU0B4C2_9FIRM|nr:VWA domain-containing protein [Desulfofundulus luciae]MDQ0287561.1 uncharacterized protein YegL [Desulfofundulus luciae]